MVYDDDDDDDVGKPTHEKKTENLSSIVTSVLQ